MRILVKIAGIRATCSVETVAYHVQKLCIIVSIRANIFLKDTVTIKKAETDRVHAGTCPVILGQYIIGGIIFRRIACKFRFLI